MRDTRSRTTTAPSVVLAIRAETAHDLPARADDAHDAVIAAEEKAVGAGADGRDVVALEEGARAGGGFVASIIIVVVGELDLGCVEEVEGPPLAAGRRGGALVGGGGDWGLGVEWNGMREGRGTNC